MARPKRLVGSEKRADAEPAPVQQSWKTDQLEGADPDFAYQFMRESEVRDRSRSKTVLNRDTGRPERVTGWTVCKEGEDDVRMLGERPDLAAAVDTTMTMGPHVLMKIPRRDYDLLQHEQDAVTDAMEDRLMAGSMFRDRIEADGVRVSIGQRGRFAPHSALMNQLGDNTNG